MKLKKILASLTAAAMAVSVMAFTPSVSRNLTVSAEGEKTLISAGAIPDGKSAVITLDCSTELQNDWEYNYYSWDIIVKTWSNADQDGDWTKMGVGGSEQEQHYNGAPYIVYSGSEIVNGSLTANFTVQPKDVFEVLYKSDDKYDVTIKTVKVFDEADGAGNVLYTWINPDLDTTEYAAQDITTEFNADYNTMTFDGTFNASKVSGPNARIEITFTPTAETNDSLVKIIDNSDPNNINWDGIASVKNNGTTDKQTASIKLSSFTLPSSIILNTWHVASIDSVVIYNDKTKGNVYSLSDEVLPKDSLSFTDSNISLNVGDGPAKTKLALKSGRTDFNPEFNIVGDSAKVEEGDNNTLIITPVSAGVTTITAKVTIRDTADYAGGSYTASCMVIVSEKSDSEILWSGSADQGTKWDWNPADISADNCNFKSGDKLVINFTVNGDADYHQLKIMDGSGDHNVLTSPAVSEWGTVDVTSSPYSIELNAADIANVNANGITITGYDVTITSVEKVSDSSSEDTSAEVIVESPAGITATVDQSELIDAVGLTPEEIAAGTKIVLNIESAASVSESDKAVIEDSVSEENDQMIELILEININKVSGNNNDVIHNLAKAIPITIDIPNYDPNKEYFIIHVKDDGTSERIDGTVSNGKFTFYAKSFSPYAIISQPRSNPPAAVTNHSIIIGSSHVSANMSSAAPGTAVKVYTSLGYDARVYAGSTLIASLKNGGTFIMPDSDVRIVAVPNMDSALLLNAKPVSYIYAYDSDMNQITVSSSRKSKTDGEITVKLGAEYAGKTVTLYSGRKNTTDMITSATADKNGNVTFTVDLGENYTAVVE